MDVAGFDTDVDGIFGEDTKHQTLKAQAWLGVKEDGIVGPKTMEAMQDKVDDELKVPQPEQPDAPDGPLSIIEGVEVWDYRGKAKLPKNARPDWGNRWPKISGLVLHRTSCVLGEKPERYFPVNCHIGVTLGGRIVLSHPWDLHIWHGDYPSRWTIGIEFDGNPTGYGDYFWKPGGGPHDITDEQVKAGWVLLKLLTDEFEKQGRPLKYIYAHRQSSDQRECDPGNVCWEKIAIPWMEKTGAVPGDIGWQGSIFGDGYRISKHWDERSPISGFRVGD
jgi:hypothetical protein